MVSTRQVFRTAPKFGQAVLYNIKGPSTLISRGFSTTSEEPPIGGEAAVPVPSNQSIKKPKTVTTGTTSGEHVYGIVKNYIREKAYGFINPLGSSETIFVHRSGIKSTKLLPTNSAISIPFLKRLERVRFLVVEEPRENGTLKSAKEVEYEDGTPIPIYRSGYVANCKKYTVGMLGELVFKTMEEDMDESVRQVKIKESYEKAKQSIDDAQTRYDAMSALLRKQS